jgi:hypothetical protein
VFSVIAEKWLEVAACPSEDGLSVLFRDISVEKKNKDETIR